MCVRECCKLSANILSCQTLHAVDLQTDVIQVRQLMGHAEFGARVVYGDCIFFTISPNEQHSALVLRLSRYRENDPYLQEATEHANTLRAMGQRDAPALETETGASFCFLVIRMRLPLSRRTPPPSNAMAEMFFQIVDIERCHAAENQPGIPYPIESKIVTPLHLAKLNKTGGAFAQEPLPTSIQKYQWI